jgi:hypothetical protein
MPHRVLARRSRAAALTTSAALAAVFAVPGLASADVSTTTVNAPAPESVFENAFIAFGLGGDGSTMTVSGTAPGADDGDLVYPACTYTLNGVLFAEPLTSEAVEVQDEAFSTDDAQQPPVTCRVRALPDDGDFDDEMPEGTDLSAFSGPRVLGGAFVTDVFTPTRAAARAADDPSQWLAYRGQGRGLGIYSGAGTPYGIGFGLGTGAGGLLESALLDDTYYRLLFFASGALGSFSGQSSTDVADAGIVVDGVAASPAVSVGDEQARVVSHRTDPTTGDLTVVETAPVALLVENSEGDVVASPSGIELRRTLVQDHGGRQIRYADDLVSIDGAAHRIEVRYSEGVIPDQAGETVEPASFRIPWVTGNDYVVPDDSMRFGPSGDGPATIYVHGPRQDYSRLLDRARASRAASRAADEVPRGEGAYTFDSSPTDGRFLAPTQFVVRFVRDVPAGGATSIRHTYSQDLDPDAIGGLVDDATGKGGTPVPPLPATTPLPTQPPPVSPAPTLTNDPLVRVAGASRGLFAQPGYGRRFRDGRSTNVIAMNLPAGRYGVTVRRYMKNGRVIARGLRTTEKQGTVKIPVHLTRFGREYLAQKRKLGRASVKVRVQVTWTPKGQPRRSRKAITEIRFR